MKKIYLFLKKRFILIISIVFLYILLSINPIIYKNLVVCSSHDATALNKNLDSFKIKILCTNEEIRHGYQNETEPDFKNGLMFVLGIPSENAFWMKDVNFNLLLLYLDASYKVVAINILKANELNPVISPPNTAYAIELNSALANSFSLGEQLIIN